MTQQLNNKRVREQTCYHFIHLGLFFITEGVADPGFLRRIFGKGWATAPDPSGQGKVCRPAIFGHNIS